MPHDVAGGVCVPSRGHQTLTSLCPQGVPGASGLKGDKVDETVLLAFSVPCHPLQPPPTSRDPPSPTDSPCLSLVSCRSPGRPWSRAARGPRRAWGARRPGMLSCSAATAHFGEPLRGTTSGLPLLQTSLLNPTSESINLISPSRVKMAALARRDPEDLW